MKSLQWALIAALSCGCTEINIDGFWACQTQADCTGDTVCDSDHKVCLAPGQKAPWPLPPPPPVECGDWQCPGHLLCHPDALCIAAGEVYIPPTLFFAWKTPNKESHMPAFAIDRFEVTAAEYAECVDAGRCTPSGIDRGTTGQGATWLSDDVDVLPINYVTWSAASFYCDYAGKRLCTDMEWSVAARGSCALVGDPCYTALLPYPWGKEEASCDFAIIKDGNFGCGSIGPAAQGAKEADVSVYGVRDMAGNVAEWVMSTRNASDSGIAWMGAHFGVAKEDVAEHMLQSHGSKGEKAFLGIRCCRTPPALDELEAQVP